MMLLLLVWQCYAGTIEIAFHNDDYQEVQRLYQDAGSRSDSLLALYRLTSLDPDLSLLERLPDDLDRMASARELAWLSALWGFRAQHAGLLKKPKYGAASIRLIEKAERLKPDDPWVMLVGGQSRLYRPGILGGSPETARERFDSALTILQHRPLCGLSALEAKIWIWMALERANDAQADALRAELLALDLPPRFRSWLEQGA